MEVTEDRPLGGNLTFSSVSLSLFLLLLKVDVNNSASKSNSRTSSCSQFSWFSKISAGLFVVVVVAKSLKDMPSESHSQSPHSLVLLDNTTLYLWSLASCNIGDAEESLKKIVKMVRLIFPRVFQIFLPVMQR